MLRRHFLKGSALLGVGAVAGRFGVQRDPQAHSHSDGRVRPADDQLQPGLEADW